MIIVNMNHVAYKTDDHEVLLPLGKASCGPGWFARFGRIQHLVTEDDYERLVTDKLKHKQLVNLAKRKCPRDSKTQALCIEMMRALPIDDLRELLLDYDLRGEDVLAWLEERMTPSAPVSERDLKLDALRDAVAEDDYHKLLTLVNDLKGGGVPKKKEALLELASELLAD